MTSKKRPCFPRPHPVVVPERQARGPYSSNYHIHNEVQHMNTQDIITQVNDSLDRLSIEDYQSAELILLKLYYKLSVEGKTEATPKSLDLSSPYHPERQAEILRIAGIEEFIGTKKDYCSHCSMLIKGKPHVIYPTASSSRILCKECSGVS